MRLIILSFFLLFIVSFSIPPSNNLINTKWMGNINAPNPTTCILTFSLDSLVVTQNSDILETMNYQLNGDTILLKKLSGISPCGQEVIGKYLYKIQQDVVTFSIIEDDCNERGGAFTPEGYKQILSK